MRRYLMTAALVVSCSSHLANSQDLPTITVVVSSADFKGRVATGSLATLFGTHLASSIAWTDSLPLPNALGGVRMIACPGTGIVINGNPNCGFVELLYVSPTQINFLSPGPSVSSVPYTIYVERDGYPSSSSDIHKAIKEISIYAFQPRVFELGYDCDFNPSAGDPSPCGLSKTQIGEKQSIRGAITDQNGSLILSSNPARVGRYYTIWLTGLGPQVRGKLATTPRIWLHELPYSGPYQTPVTTLSFTYAGPSPEFPGLDQINFQLPLDLLGRPDRHNGGELRPCGDYRLDLSLTIDRSDWLQNTSNTVYLPVLVRNGDVPCR